MAPNLERRLALPAAVSFGAVLLGIAMVGLYSISPLKAQVAVVLAITLLIFLISSRPSDIHITIAVVLYMFAHTNIALAAPQLSNYTRGLALLVILTMVLRSKRRDDQPSSVEMTVLLVTGASAYAMAIATHGIDSNVASDAFSLISACLVMTIGVRRLPTDTLRRGMERALFLALGLSAAAGLLTPGTAIRGGRLAGVFVNANTLGFFAALGLLMGVTVVTGWSRWTLLSLSTATLVAAGSRSPLLAFVVAMIVASISVIVKSERRSLRLLILTALGSFAGYFVITSLQSSNLFIVRDNNSRSGGTNYARYIADISPWRGIGYGRAQVEIASTPLRWLAETGILGLALVVIAYVFVMVLALRRSWPSVLVATFGVTSSLFEGWYFAGGSALFLGYWLVYFSSDQSSRNTSNCARGHTATHASL